jgi:hypothetical protein
MPLALLLALTLLVPIVRARPALQGDALTGIWRGRGTGNAPTVPPEGVQFSLRLEARGTDEALATLTLEGLPPAAPVEASFDAESGELEFRCDLIGIQLDFEAVIAGEELTGKASGLGMSVELTGKRTTRELPSLEVPKPAAPRVRVDLATLDAAAWREDLAFLAAELPLRHKNAFHALTREEWERRVHALDARLDTLAPAAAAVALAQLVAAVGDAHTGLGLVGAPFDRFLPLQISWFEDGLFVTAVDQRFEPLLAARVRRIGLRSVEEAVAAVRTTFAAENESWPRVQAPQKLAQPGLLAALGVTVDATAIPLVVEGPGGADLALTVDGSGSGQWVVAPDPAFVPAPLWRQRTREAYWFAPADGGRALYFAYNRCAEDPARPMQAFIGELCTALAAPGVERLVLDLRHNSGGNSAVLSAFLPQLAAHPRLAEPGALRVLIGAATYSSGMMNAYQLRDEVRARLYGEPTGGKPNSYGELRTFALPRSGLDVYYSTKYFRAIEGDPPAVEPDVRVPLTSADHFAGVDPVMERAVAD